jgi:hypothetical protein
MRGAWKSNCQGLRSHLEKPTQGDYLFRVYQTTTGVIYLMGKLSIKKWGMDLSEVISNTNSEADLELFEKFLAEKTRFQSRFN